MDIKTTLTHCVFASRLTNVRKKAKYIPRLDSKTLGSTL